ncbi:alpha-amylase family protein [Gordonia sp. NPDC003504]
MSTWALRVERYRDDLVDAVTQVYGASSRPTLIPRLLGTAERAFAARSADLRELDERRLLRPDWLQQPDMVGYAAYTERFAGTLADVADRVGHLRELGVTYLHLMPLLAPRPGDNDGGYAVADYRRVRPDLGTTDDLAALAAILRASGISLVVDLVLNHVAREHEWARAAVAGDPHYRDYFLTFPDRDEPDRYSATLPEVFPDFAPGNFTFDTEMNRWVWTTFHSWQWDLNWANPDVLVEFAEIIFFLANLGVEVVRLDAIAFLWKRMGTDCQNQPEVHAITQILRALTHMVAPAVAFKAEAIVGPAQLVAYLGVGRHYGRISDLAYHNSLMVQIWSMIACADTRLAAHALGSLPPTPATGTWICYVRCHDDIGWAIDDADAAAVGLDGAAHRRFLSDWYSGEFPESPAAGLVFQANPRTGDRRISGTAAALTGLQTAIDDASVNAALGRMFLIHAIIYGWGGIPVIWSGDELGTPNDAHWAAEPGHADDNRWAHRPRLDPARPALRDDTTTVPGRLFAGLRHLGRIRSSLPHLHARVPSEIAWADGPVLVTLRRAPLGPMICVYNVSACTVSFPVEVITGHGFARPWDVISDRAVTADADGLLWLTPYAAWWVIETAPEPGVA